MSGFADRHGFASRHGFANRHIGPDHDEQAKMLAVVGYGSLDELVADAVPESIREEVGRRTALPAARSEEQVLARLRELASQNRVATSSTLLVLSLKHR
jgi:glycine dehydrogenase